MSMILTTGHAHSSNVRAEKGRLEKGVRGIKERGRPQDLRTHKGQETQISSLGSR